MTSQRRIVGAALVVSAMLSGFVACDPRAARTPGAAERRPANDVNTAPRTTPRDEDDASVRADDVDADLRADGSVDVPAPSAPSAPSAAPAHFISLDVDDDAWIARMRTAQSTRFKPVGTSSLVFKATFTGGAEAAFRPRTRTHSRGWTSEVAAYRIARALDMDQVPPAVSRAFSRSELESHLHADFSEDWPALDEQMMGRGDIVWGTLVYWVPGLRDLELDTPRGMATWSRWLAHDAGVVSADEASLAGDLGTMLCFDYLIANVDRWSGGNVRADRTGRRVVIRDHNLAFLSPLPRAQHERVIGHVRRVERFSRSFVLALRSLDESRLRASLAVDPAVAAGTTLLDDAQIRALFDRREALLSRVAAHLDAYGEVAVLAFP